jgi:hypothetical protein
VTNTRTGAVSDPFTFTITFERPNAPSRFVNPAAGFYLHSTARGGTRSPATGITELLRGRVVDPNSLMGEPTHQGIAITQVDSSNGRWEITFDKGDTWEPITQVSESSAQLVEADDSETAIRFVPNPGFTGVAQFQFRTWDQTEGENSSFADTTNAGGTSAYGLELSLAIQQVLPEKAAPTFTPGSDQVVNEDAGVVVVPGWASSIHGDNYGDPVLFQVEVTEDSSTDAAVTAPVLQFTQLPQISSDGTLSFQAAPDSFGTALFVVSALSGSTGSVQQFPLRITVRPVNDAPTLTVGPNIVLSASSGPLRLTGWASNITAGPANESSQTLSVSVTTTNSQLFTVQPALDLATGALTFTPSPTASGTAVGSFTLKDNGGRDNGGQDTTTRTVTITITPSAVPGEHNIAWLDWAYHDLLGRALDPLGSAYWSGLLAQGASRLQVVQDIQTTVEFYQHQATNLYRAYLHREVDVLGLNYVTQQFAQGATLDQVRATLLGSDEYFQLHGGTKAGFVAGLYNDVLQRAVDASGSSYWTQVLATGASRAQVALGILGSTEAGQEKVSEGYHTLLGREVDQTGLSFWTQSLQNGMTVEVFLAMLIASDEYYTRIR